MDSVGAIAGGLGGICSNTSYIESAAGVAEGGRTGLTAVVVGVLFLLAIPLTPLVALVPFAATGSGADPGRLPHVHIDQGHRLRRPEDGLPALFTIMLMPLTYNITIGIGAGFVSYVLIKVVRGKIREVHALMWVVSIAFLIYFAQAPLTTLFNQLPGR